MRPSIVFFLFLIHSLSYGQIEIKVQKTETDTISIQFPNNMKIKIGTEYEFIYRTNIQISDSLKESLGGQYLHEGLQVTKAFNHYERGILITTKDFENEIRMNHIVGHSMFFLDGTNKWKVKLDGNYISRNIPNDIRQNSVIEIEIQSDNYELTNINYQKPAALLWLHNNSVSEKFEFHGEHLKIDLSEYPDFISEAKNCEKYSTLVLLLPQVTLDNHKLFSDKPMHRMYFMRFVD